MQNELIHSLTTHHPLEYEPTTPLSSNDEWLLPFIHDQLHPDNLCPNDGVETIYYLGFENEFNCPEANCILHSHWSFHFRPVRRSQIETVTDLNDDNLLETKIQDSLGAFMQSRFPSVHFTRASLLNDSSDPRILQ